MSPTQPSDRPLTQRPRILAVIALPILLWVVDLARIVWPGPLLADASYALLAGYLIVTRIQLASA